MSAADPRQSAAEYFQRAYELQMAGEYQQAIELYSQSIAAFPTAEAYTFRGWTYSFLGDYDRAISECLEAIQVDPEFGNPYNDIGAYLIEQEKWEEAIPWFEKAMKAPRYEARYIHISTWGACTSISGSGRRRRSAIGRPMRWIAGMWRRWRVGRDCGRCSIE